MVPILLLLVLIVGIGVSVIALRNRAEHGIESGISSFRREMRALAPRRGESGSPLTDDHRRVEQDTGVHVLDDAPAPEARADHPDHADDFDRDDFDRDDFDHDFDDPDDFGSPADTDSSDDPAGAG